MVKENYIDLMNNLELPIRKINYENIITVDIYMFSKNRLRIQIDGNTKEIKKINLETFCAFIQNSEWRTEFLNEEERKILEKYGKFLIQSGLV